MSRFVCDVCGKSFSRKHDRERHHKKLHNSSIVYETNKPKKIKNVSVKLNSSKKSNNPQTMNCEISDNLPTKTQKVEVCAYHAELVDTKTNTPINNYTEQREISVKEIKNVDETDELLIVLIKQNQEINELNQEINKQHREINKQNLELSEQNRKLNECDQKLNEQNQEINKQHQEINKQNLKLSEQNRKLNECDQKLNEQNQKLFEHNHRLKLILEKSENNNQQLISINKYNQELLLENSELKEKLEIFENKYKIIQSVLSPN